MVIIAHAAQRGMDEANGTAKHGMTADQKPCIVNDRKALLHAHGVRAEPAVYLARNERTKMHERR